LILVALFIITTAEVKKCQLSTGWIKEAQLLEQSTVLLHNDSMIVPLKDLAGRRIASVNIGAANASVFDSILNKYTDVARFSASGYQDTTLNKLSTSLRYYNTVIVQLNTNSLADSKTVAFIADLIKGRQVIAVVSGAAGALKALDGFSLPVVWTEEETPASAAYTAQLIFGGVAASAKLPEDVSLNYKKGDGYTTTVVRLKYTVPEDAGINSADLEQPIDKIVNEAIAQKATPGAVVMVVKDGKVLFNKAYGTHTYVGGQSDKVGDIFDLASVTKIAATTIAVMRLYEQQKLMLDSSFGTYMPLARNTSKSDLRIRELMLHEAGLTPFIPFYASIKPGDFSSDSTSYYSVKVADNYYLRRNYYEDVMLPRMLNTKLQIRGKYEYSDLSMYFMKEVIEQLAAEPLDKYVLDEFYKPLGMQTAGFTPRNRFDKRRIVPTEQDTYFRKTLLEGYVHDQGASMAGGVAGHAGLFASANDLAILCQMFLNCGTYGGAEYFKPETVQLFTKRQSSRSRRALGFDGWDPETKKYPSMLASPQTYGHTGYTGTCVWIDPAKNLVYIFLSNRVHPRVTDKLSALKIRPRIQDVIYEAIEKGMK